MYIPSWFYSTIIYQGATFILTVNAMPSNAVMKWDLITTCDFSFFSSNLVISNYEAMEWKKTINTCGDLLFFFKIWRYPIMMSFLEFPRCPLLSWKAKRQYIVYAYFTSRQIPAFGFAQHCCEICFCTFMGTALWTKSPFTIPLQQ